jgi:hypothetical protein
MGRIIYPIYEMENKKSLKPPTSLCFIATPIASTKRTHEKLPTTCPRLRYKALACAD